MRPLLKRVLLSTFCVTVGFLCSSKVTNVKRIFYPISVQRWVHLCSKCTHRHYQQESSLPIPQEHIPVPSRASETCIASLGSVFETMNDNWVEEEEEILVVVQFPGLEDVLGSQTQNLVLEIDENGEKLNAILDDHLFFSGKFEVSLGTQLIFEETPTPNSNSRSVDAKSVQCIGTSITTVPFDLKSTTDIDKLNNAIHNPTKLSDAENISVDHSSG